MNGITNVVLRTIQELDSSRVRSHLCSIYDDDHLAFAFRECGLDPVFVGHTGAGSMVTSIARVARIIRERKIDLVHANQVIDFVIAGTAARLCGVPVVVTLHWTADSTDNEQLSIAERARSRIAALIRHTVRIVSDRYLADRIIAVSDAVASTHAEVLGRWFPMSKVSVVYPGLDLGESSGANGVSVDERARLREELNVGAASPVLLNIGRLDPVKGQKHLIPMMHMIRQRWPRSKLLIAGDGQLRDELAAQIEAYSLSDNITMLGWRLDVDELLCISDVLVVSSETEAAPLPLLEAARQSKPVVATRVGGIPEILEDGVNGYMVPRADPAAMAAAVLRITDTPGEATRMGENAHRMALERFGIGTSVRALELIYESLVERGPRAAAPS